MSSDEQDSKIHKLEEDEKKLKEREKELGMEYFKLNQRLEEIKKEQLALDKKIKLSRKFRENLKRESQTQINQVNIVLKDEMHKVGVDDLKKDVGVGSFLIRKEDNKIFRIVGTRDIKETYTQYHHVGMNNWSSEETRIIIGFDLKSIDSDNVINGVKWDKKDGFWRWKRCFHGINLRGADLKNIRLYKMDFERANFEGADLRGASIEHCSFKNTNFNLVDLRTTKVSGCDFQGANVKETIYDQDTTIRLDKKYWNNDAVINLNLEDMVKTTSREERNLDATLESGKNVFYTTIADREEKERREEETRQKEEEARQKKIKEEEEEKYIKKRPWLRKALERLKKEEGIQTLPQDENKKTNKIKLLF